MAHLYGICKALQGSGEVLRYLIVAYLIAHLPSNFNNRRADCLLLLCIRKLLPVEAPGKFRDAGI